MLKLTLTIIPLDNKFNGDKILTHLFQVIDIANVLKDFTEHAGELMHNFNINFSITVEHAT